MPRSALALVTRMACTFGNARHRSGSTTSMGARTEEYPRSFSNRAVSHAAGSGLVISTQPLSGSDKQIRGAVSAQTGTEFAA